MDIAVIFLLICLYVVPGLIRRLFDNDRQAADHKTVTLPVQPPLPQAEECPDCSKNEMKLAKEDISSNSNKESNSISKEEYLDAVTQGIIWAEILQPPLAYRKRRS